jgi:two-component system, OmpR family, phosphate regulon sensor histidine kinase PhoR
MSRTVLWIVTVFLALAMVAMILVQAYWIRRSLESEGHQLGLVVNDVLTDISNELVQNETVIAILDEIQPPVIQYQSQAVWNYHIDNRSAYDRTEKEVGLSGGAQKPGKDPEEPKTAFSYIPPDPSLRNLQVEMINDSLLVVVGEDLAMKDTILVTAMHPDLVRRELRTQIARQEYFVDHIVKQMLMEEGDALKNISASQIEASLSEKLSSRGVGIPYEYAVYEMGHKPIFSSENFNEYEQCRYFRRSLFPSSVFNRSIYISFYFPQERLLLRKSMGIMGASSLTITLFIIIMFSLTLYIMFKQKRLSEIKNDFVNNMTHELKTPISTISLASQMLNDRSISEEQKNLGHISKIIETESKQLGYQVERVLQMAIFDHGELKLKIESVDIHDIIETVAQNFLLQMDKRGGRLEFHPEADQTLVKGDLMHLTNVISNLMENALKYTTRIPQISISTHNETGHVIVSVADNGMGISKEDQKRIFEKFYRVPTGNVHNVKGFGLGLSYVKLIVEEHGGTIKIKSEPNKGSRFDILLPLSEQK